MQCDYYADHGTVDVDNFKLVKFTSVIDEIYQAAYGQRKFIRENALNEFTKFFQNQIWLLLFIILIVLSIVLSLKYYLLTKTHFWSSMSTSTFYLIAALLSNNSGKKFTNSLIYSTYCKARYLKDQNRIRIGFLPKTQHTQSGQVICQWKGHAKRRKKSHRTFRF